MLYEKLFTAGYIEAFLNGTPPRCEIALDECMILSAPTPRPRSVSLRLAKMAATSQLEIYRDLEAVSNVRSMLVASLVLPEAA
jgi:hypothetical protein